MCSVDVFKYFIFARHKSSFVATLVRDVDPKTGMVLVYFNTVQSFDEVFDLGQWTTEFFTTNIYLMKSGRMEGHSCASNLVANVCKVAHFSDKNNLMNLIPQKRCVYRPQYLQLLSFEHLRKPERHKC